MNISRGSSGCRSWLAALIVGFGLSVTPTFAAAQPASAGSSEQNMNEAKSRYKAGLTLYDDGAYDAARVQFERAYELAPSYKILYNIGLVYKQLNEFVGSLKALQRYLAEGGGEVPEDRKAEVTKMIETLEGIVGYARVSVNLPGAEITVDDAVVTKSPAKDAIMLNPGKRKIGAKLQGYLPDTKVITVASGDKPEVHLTLEKQTTIVQKGTDVKPLIAWIVTGAFAVGAGVTGVLALNAKNDLEDKKKVRSPDPPAPSTLHSDIDKQHTSMKTLALVTDILGACAIVSAGVAVYFTFSRKEEASPPPSSPPKATASFGFGLGSAGVHGTF